MTHQPTTPLTPTQSTFLRIITDCARRGRSYVPRNQGDTRMVEGRPIREPSGPGASAAWRALVAKGLIEPNVILGGYAARATPEGLRVAELELGRPLAWVQRSPRVDPGEDTEPP